MRFDEIIIELLDIDIILKDTMLDSLKCFEMNENAYFKTSPQILESVYVPSMSKVKVNAIAILKYSIGKKIRSILFI